jgi:IS4 transposase
LRKENPDKYIELAKSENAVIEKVRDGKIVYYSENKATLTGKLEGEFKSVEVRQVVRLTERTIDKNKQHLLLPDNEIDVWYTNVEVKHDCKKIVALYKDHGTCEQFHSELKTDLDIERMPSGKFETNRLILSMAMIAFNILRLIGQETIKSGHANRKKQVGRLRIRKVLQDIMYMAGKFLIKCKIPTIKIPEINKFKDAFSFIFRKLQLE